MTIVANIVKKNFHRDSVQLLHLSEEAKKIEGVEDAAIVMGTSTNKEILSKLGLLMDNGKLASDTDMILAVKSKSQSLSEQGLHRIEEMVLRPRSKGGRFNSIEDALQAVPNANLAIVSVPGEYARPIVLKALENGVNVHLFSDHVSAEHELELKQYAKQKGLLVMGPGAGTAIIGGKAIGFANVVKRGNIGIVAAAGTGLQEVSVLLSEVDLGISAALGVGGGDVKAKIGGLMMLQSIEALEHDPATDTVVIVSKPPDPQVKKLVLDYIAQNTKKRYVTCFLSLESYQCPATAKGRITGTKTLHGAFLETTRRAGIRSDAVNKFEISPSDLTNRACEIAKGLGKEQKYIRGLYTGGTLAYESLIILNRIIGRVYSNAPLDPKLKLPNSYQSVEDSIVDLGEEEFTAGRAHPMIDPTLRKIRLVEEARDPNVAVIIMDIMLGYGSHADPAGAMLDAIDNAKKIAHADGRVLPILAHVCGTENDPQPLSEQITKLRDVGVYIFPTNAMMAIASALVSRKGTINSAILGGVCEDLLGAF